LFGLYYLADDKLVELGLLPNKEAYKAGYYQQMMNGLMTQLVRIEPGKDIEEAHMRNRQLIANWCYQHANGEMEIIERDGEQCGWEGCLSVPGKTGQVTRPRHVVARALNENMEDFIVEGEDLLARAICHELDHLDGHMYVELVEGKLYTNEELDEMFAEEAAKAEEEAGEDKQ
jgi:peptide deformylase